MKSIEITQLGLNDLNFEEKISINGGHEGVAYTIGKSVGKALIIASTIIGICAFILMPKS
jgi:hypothetical protein